MKDISEITVCVVDHGLFLPVAQRMAKACKRVLYHTHWEKGFPTIKDCCVGDGFADIERCDDIWKAMPEIDLILFPDIQHSGLQLELERQGKAVWGARNGDSLELNREKFLRVLEEIGLPVPQYTVIEGLTELRSHLADKTDKFIKISRYRRDMETWHWRDYSLDSSMLDSLAVKFGPAQDLIPFLVFDPIECDAEDGGDTYCIDGQWPDLMLHGVESKDKCYLAAVTKFQDMPEDLQAIMEAFSPVLKKYRYRNEWSMETRDGVFIDPTCRGGLPSTGSQLNTWKNFPEIVWHGAHGELIQPMPAFQFSAEAILSLKSRKDEWAKIEIHKDLKDACKFASCCEIEGLTCFPPDPHGGDEVGWLVAGGDTPKETIDNLLALAKDLPEGLSAATDQFPQLLENILKAEDDGTRFTDQIMPEPGDAVSVE